MPESTALVVVDMLNTYEHEDAEPLIESVRTAVPSISAVIAGAKEAGLPLIYVNDNDGDWSAGGRELGERALGGRARELVEPVLPPEGTAFVPKARHSIFYETPLEYLLRSEQVTRIVLVGQVTEQCILYSALDAYVRHFEVIVPRDAVAHIHEQLADAALEMMERNMRAELTDADSLFASS